MRIFAFGLLIALTGAAPIAVEASEDFRTCLAELEQRAQSRGLPSELVGRVFGELQYQPRVIELDRSQPEFLQSFSAYMRARVNDARVWRGRLALVEHADLLIDLTQRYGVPGHYLVSFWGLETNFGSYLGTMPTLDSLATLACDPRRSEFFAEQLLVAVDLLERESLTPEKMRGSWAGAMGHTQFLPTVYRDHAIDGDRDGRVDLWGSEVDALASAANYLKALGWNAGERWGREVKLPAGFDYGVSGMQGRRPLQQWRALGVMRADGAQLPVADMDAALLLPMGHRGPAFLVYENFEVIMRWNRSQSYAIAVGHLADRIVGGGGLLTPLPERDRAPPRARVRALQQRLTELGFEPGEADGVLGPATRAALRAFQHDAELPADGYPDEATFDALGLGQSPRQSAVNPPGFIRSNAP